MSIQNTPENILDRNDKGDDTQLRFRYQATYAAQLSLGLLSNPPNAISQIYCEHHEDILIKNIENLFTGVQVKTRLESQEPFKANDPQILHAIKKFVDLEKIFPKQFNKYMIVTNHGFWNKRDNGSNLVFILNLAKTSTTLNSPVLKSYIKKISKNPSDSEMIHGVLKKIELNSKLPKLHDCEISLVEALSKIPEYKGKTIDAYYRAAKALCNELFQASSLAYNRSLCGNFVMDEDGQEDSKAIIEGKRITKEKIKKICDEHMSDGVLLQTRKEIAISDLPRGLSKMKLKMAKGGITADNIDHIADCTYSMDKISLEWLNKYGEKQAQDRLNHLKVIVKTEYLAEDDNHVDKDKILGQQMLVGVKEKLILRHSNESKAKNIFDVMYEHLLGMAGILTEDCEFWWGKKFDITKDKS